MNKIHECIGVLITCLVSLVSLFGVFIIFRLQQLKEQLVGQGKALVIEFDKKCLEPEAHKYKNEDKWNKINDLKINSWDIKKDDVVPLDLILERLKKAIARKDVLDIIVHFNYIVQMIPSFSMKRDYRKYSQLLDKKRWIESLSRAIIVFTAIVIIVLCIKLLIPHWLSDSIIVIFLFAICLLSVLLMTIFSLKDEKSYPEDFENQSKIR